MMNGIKICSGFVFKEQMEYYWEIEMKWNENNFNYFWNLLEQFEVCVRNKCKKFEILFYFILFYFILFYFILFYFILF